jgi:hypothetical protein
MIEALSPVHCFRDRDILHHVETIWFSTFVAVLDTTGKRTKLLRTESKKLCLMGNSLGTVKQFPQCILTHEFGVTVREIVVLECVIGTTEISLTRLRTFSVPSTVLWLYIML